MAVPKHINSKYSAIIMEDTDSNIKARVFATLDSSSLNASKKYEVIDQLDTPFWDASSVNIPASSGTPVTVVSSLAADTYRMVIVEDIGEYIGLYSDPSGTPTLIGILPLGGGVVDFYIAAGTELGLRAMNDAAITNYNIAINFLG